MKRFQKFLIVIVLVVTLSAFCGGSAETELKLYESYYNTIGNLNVPVSFQSGLQLELEDLDGYTSVEARWIADDQAGSLDAVDVDAVECAAHIDLTKVLKEVQETESLHLEIIAYREEMPDIIHSATLQNVDAIEDESSLEADDVVQVLNLAHVRIVDEAQQNPENPRELWFVDAKFLFVGFDSGNRVEASLNAGEPVSEKLSGGGDCKLGFGTKFAEGDVLVLNLYREDKLLQTLEYAMCVPSLQEETEDNGVISSESEEAAEEMNQLADVQEQMNHVNAELAAETSAAVFQEPADSEKVTIIEKDINKRGADEVAASSAEIIEVTPMPTAEIRITAEPTEEPTLEPTVAPTAIPTATPTVVPTEEPSMAPTAEPTPVAVDNPTQEPTEAPTEIPTAVPTETPTVAPTAEPTPEPVPQVQVFLITEEGREYPFVQEAAEPAYIRSDAKLKLESIIVPEEQAENFKWTLSFLEIRENKDDKRIGKEKKITGALSFEEGELPQEDTRYRIVAEYEWKDQEGKLELIVIRKSFDAWLASEKDTEKRIESGAAIAEKDLGTLVLCSGDGTAPTVKANGTPVELVMQEAAEDADHYTYKMNLPAEASLILQITDSHGNQEEFTLNIDLKPEVFLIKEDGKLYPADSISGKTEAGAVLSLKRKGDASMEAEAVELGSANKLGEFEFKLPEGTVIGDLFELIARDAVGNETGVEIEIVEELPEPLQLISQEDIIITAAHVSTGFLLQGSGEPGMVFYGYIDGSEKEFCSPTIAEDGSWSITLMPEHFQHENGIHVIDLKMKYVKNCDLRFTVTLDTLCDLTMNPITEDDTVIHGETDPGALVEMMIGEKRYIVFANDMGEYDFSVVLEANQEIILNARDRNGNVAATLNATVVPVVGEKICFTMEQTEAGLIFSGTAKPGFAFDIYMDGELLVTGLQADENGAFVSDPVTNRFRSDVYAFEGKYQSERFASFSSDVLEAEIDTSVPVLTLDQDDFSVQDTILSGYVDEPAEIFLFADGSQIAQVNTGENNRFQIEIGVQQKNTALEIYARDAYGNIGAETELIVQSGIRQIVVVDAPVQGAKYSYMDPVRVSGCVFTEEPAEGLQICIAGEYRDIDISASRECFAEEAEKYAEWINAAYCVPFELTVDISPKPLGEIAIEIMANGTPVDIAQAESGFVKQIGFESIKPNDYLTKRIVILVAMLLGFIISAVILRKTNKKLRVLRDAEIDSNNNKSRLTITRKDNG